MTDIIMLKTLLERVQNATQADLQLDADIERCLDPATSDSRARHAYYRGMNSTFPRPEAVTGSIEAAARVAPRGHDWTLFAKQHPGSSIAYFDPRNKVSTADEIDLVKGVVSAQSLALISKGATPALAVCAAALMLRIHLAENAVQEAVEA